ncbi:Sulfite reductase [NADPH] flavoprotein alpha-component [Pontibacillus chungwhensis BH030062]|uniref:assimilatory sulfite reductase (NADPH) n=1 Tax=Pontibacillus chungwhensis BH030062 TaxID=1385513 RepID=A0A0A2VBM7_9BACI|nr:assimilatory sulfite reductase (NADPH) flavoprotein subunit [Pontibacillus chungwhensis]KGP91080.1 Sulfite reductase [NADPH] flavoprotein alpha-component [Pontibacillus chungwhensis BH030062]
MSLKVTNSPFNQEQIDLLNHLFPTLTESQKIWLSGYLASAQVGNQEGTVEATDTTKGNTPQTRKVTILYGSHTGNCEALAKEFTEQLQAVHLEVECLSMDDIKPKNIKKVEDLLIVTSTHGDGDPPDNALSLYDFLHSKRAPSLEGVRFSVLSLGDSSYEFFCQTGKDLDKRLEELGASRLYNRVDCDLDYEEPAQEWIEAVKQELGQEAVASPAPASAVIEEQTNYSKKNPFKAEILENLDLNGRGSNKETRHLELDLEGSGITYEPGDSLGIYPENDPALVEQLLQVLEWDGDLTVPVNKQGEELALREALRSIFDITTLSKPLLEKTASLSDSLQKWLEENDSKAIQDYVYGRDLIDLVTDFAPWKGEVSDFVALLRKIPVRLYSIASSQNANPDEVHLTIGALRYEAHGRKRSGVCSVQCSERSSIGDHLPVFVQKNSNFKLPEQKDTPIIMIGAGTGVAPYRAFLQEREETEDKGPSWLYFGEQHFVSDFLYQTEWQSWLSDGVLSKMDVAFSRDTEEKVYVQHRLLENSKEVYEWLKGGAYVYVCGDETYMAKDVQNALLEIIQKEGNYTAEEAETYLNQLRKEKRYQRDVY